MDRSDAEGDNSNAPLEGDASSSSLRGRAVSGAVITILGFGAGQVLRFGSNLILARLLFPEAFGLMAVVNMFMQGLRMFTDIGLSQAIIQHERGGDEMFLNTAWTVQVVRGAGLAVCMCVLAWPLAAMYREHQLVWLLPAVGVNSALQALSSVSLARLNRNLVLGRQIITDLSGQIVTVITMVGVAWIHPTVWALVLGGTTGTAVSVLLSHYAIPGHRHRFSWDPASRKDLFRFGRWITLSTAFTFLALQGDRFILSTFTSMAVIGIYSVASGLSQIVQTIAGKLTASILFPLFAAWRREGGDRLRQQLLSIRLKVLGLFLLPPVVLAIFGDHVVRLLYDHRYHDAGWMVPLLGVALIPQLIVATSEPILLATGDSYRHMMVTIIKGVIMLVAMALGGYLGDVKGLLIGAMVASFLQYPVVVPAIREKKVWMPGLDAIAVVGSLGLVVVGRFCVAKLGF